MGHIDSFHTHTHTDKPVSYENEHEGWFHPDVMPSP